MAMPKIEFRCQMFRGDWDQVWSQKRMVLLMEALVRVNQTHLQEFEAFVKRGLAKSNFPSVYRSGLHYETEKGTEIWPDIPSLLEGTMGQGVYPGPWGDCEDLACYRTAELRELPWHYERPSKFAKGLRPEGLRPEGLRPEGLRPEGLRPEGLRPEGLRPEGRMECADPRFPQEDLAIAATIKKQPWPGWKRVVGGIKAMPYAKWRRGPQGQYHYHAILQLPDGRLEDPSLVLGMGKESEFAEADMANKLKSGETPVVLQYATQPDVMVVDPEKPSGYNGGKSKTMDAEVLKRTQEEIAATRTSLSSGAGDLEAGAYQGNPVGQSTDTQLLKSEGITDIDRLIGWSRELKQFIPYSTAAELRRLRGYGSR